VPEDLPARSDVATDNPVPTPPFWGTRVVKGVQLADYAAFLDERATFMGQWGLKPGRGDDGLSYEELVETEGRPRLAEWLDRIRTESILDPTVVYGYFPVWSEGDDVVVAHHTGPDGSSGGEPGTERLRFRFPRQRRDRHLCLADFVKPRAWAVETGRFDVLPVQLVTVGDSVSVHTARLFEANRYREYMELHGLSVQLTEALAELWHARVRSELGFADEDPSDVEGMFKLDYRGARFSLGYPACPDMEDRRKVVELLRPERVGVTLSEELQLHPEQSTDAFVFHHPEAKYFSV
jgi:5-methyltetrahydrofolate--homocysteine methyltransferase